MPIIRDDSGVEAIKHLQATIGALTAAVEALEIVEKYEPREHWETLLEYTDRLEAERDELRERLKAYEDTGLEPGEITALIDRLAESFESPCNYYPEDVDMFKFCNFDCDKPDDECWRRVARMAAKKMEDDNG